MFSYGYKCKMIIVTSNTDGIYATMDMQEEIKKPKEAVEKQDFNLWGWVKAISTLVIVGVFSFKVYQTPIALTVDFPTLLSLLLGFFSVGLAALFYFKATDTSNAFYDNTNKFTKDIAQLLAKIEAGFGERLKNIEDSNTSVRDQFFQLAQKRQVLEGEIEEDKSEVERIKAEKDNVIGEKDRLIDELIENSKLDEKEKEDYKRKIIEAETGLKVKNKKLEEYAAKLNERVEQLNSLANENQRIGFNKESNWDRNKNEYNLLTDKHRLELVRQAEQIIKSELGNLRIVDRFSLQKAFEYGNIPRIVHMAMDRLDYIGVDRLPTEDGYQFVYNTLAKTRSDSDLF
jgi:hypothetical protein